MKKTEVFRTQRSVAAVLPQLCQWIETEQKMPHPEESKRGNTVVLRSRLSGFLRQMSGLVFELTVELTPTGDGFVATVDNGDIRKQLAAMGIAWFLFWPVIIPLGYAHLANNKIVTDVLAKLNEVAAP